MTGALRYVGKSGVGLARVAQHVYHNPRERTHKAAWIRVLLAQDLRPDAFVIEECAGHDATSAAETFWIGYFRAIGCDLTNHTLGGDGAPGRRSTSASRARMSASALNRAPLTERELARLREEHRARTTAREEPPRDADWRQRQAAGRGARPFRDQDGTKYASVREAARRLGLDHQRVSAVLAGRAAHTHGFTFTFI